MGAFACPTAHLLCVVCGFCVFSRLPCVFLGRFSLSVTPWRRLRSPLSVYPRGFSLCFPNGKTWSLRRAAWCSHPGVANLIYALLVFPCILTSVARLVRRSGACECPLADVWHFDVFLLSVADAETVGVRRREGMLVRSMPLQPTAPLFDPDHAFSLRVSRVKGVSHRVPACCPRRCFMPVETSFENVP